MIRGKGVTVLAILVAACSSFGTEEGGVIEKNADGINIKIGYDAVGAATRSMAAEHCENFGKQAVWYGHDRNGFMHFKCQ